MQQLSPPAYKARRFAPQIDALSMVQKHHGFRSNQVFQPVPQATRPYPYRMDLAEVIGAEAVAAIRNSGRLTFHILGDTGGVQHPEPQQIVAMKMEDDFAPGSKGVPSFLYILGDLIYYNGEVSQFYPQFYEPYSSYPAPILSIPGNHDGDPIDASTPTLKAYVENFCALQPHLTPEAQDSNRDAMTQPNPYWTLTAPFVTIIGVYSNVPEGGRLDGDQVQWLEAELAAAPHDAAVLVTMHHPIYSADAHHGGSSYMGGVLDQAIQASRRSPDMVLCGHVHNYQRFTRTTKAGDLPYIVAGAGGYWHLHYVAKDASGNPVQPGWRPPGLGVVLEAYADSRHGFMRLQITPDAIHGEYVTVPHPQESWRTGPTSVVDSFTLNVKSHRVTGHGAVPAPAVGPVVVAPEPPPPPAAAPPAPEPVVPSGPGHFPYRLGRKPPVTDRRTLRLATYLKPELPSPPPTLDVTEAVSNWGMLANDRYGDCTCAAAAHMEMVWSRIAGQPQDFTEQQVLDLYNRCNGGADDGCTELYVLGEWRRGGLGGTTIYAFTQVPTADLMLVRQAAYIFSGLYIGVALPVTAQAQIQAQAPWDVVAAGPSAEPWSWGGHAVSIVAYDDAGLTCVTWGRLQRMTWAFWQRYVEEAWAIIPTDFQNLPAGQKIIGSLDFNQLVSDLQAITGSNLPPSQGWAPGVAVTPG
jgi:acid phosphatase type 7